MPVAEKYDAMISHSAGDKAIADRACLRLEQSGICCWIAPRDVTPGFSYAEEVIDAINGSRVLVLILTRRSNESPHVLREVERAVSKGLRIVPFKIGDFALSKPMEYLVSSQHWLTVPDPPTDAHLDQLVRAVTPPAPGRGAGEPTAAVKLRRRTSVVVPVLLAAFLVFLDGWLALTSQMARASRTQAAEMVTDSAPSVPTQSLLLDAYEPTDLKLSLWSDHGPAPVFREGEVIHVFGRATHDCLAYVAYIAQDSSVTWLVPREGEGPKRLRAATTLELTNNLDVTVRPPFGNDVVRVFAAEHSLPMETIFAGAGGPGAKILALRALVGRLSPVEMYAEHSLPVKTVPRN
jgi:hypothetical protein